MRARHILALLAGLAGCATVAGVAGDHVTAQMANYQSLQASGDLKTIAATPVVDCGAEAAACTKLHAMRADACLAVAMQTRHGTAACPVSSADTSRLLGCAVTEYDAVPQRAAAQAANQSAALYCRAETEDAVAAQGDAERAEQAGAAGNAAGLLWAGRGAALLAAFGPAATRCSAANRALHDAKAGIAQGGGDAGALVALDHDASALAARLPACTAAGGT